MKRKTKIIMYSVLSLIALGLIGLIMYIEIPRIKYTYDEKDDSYTIARVYGDLKSYDIPSTYKGKKVTRIGNKAFQNHQNLEGLAFTGEANIEYIGQLAFYNCDSLKEINMPDSVTRIANNAFLSCDSLEMVTFNSTSRLEVLEGSVFYDCLNLSEVILPQSLNKIGSFCFLNTNILRMEIYKDTVLEVDALKGVNMNNVVILEN